MRTVGVGLMALTTLIMLAVVLRGLWDMLVNGDTADRIFLLILALFAAGYLMAGGAQ